MELKNLSHGDIIDVKLGNGLQKKFSVFIGDATLKGKKDQIWLKSEYLGEKVYLRKLPQEPLSIGIAIFSSKSELEDTLMSGYFYIA